MYAIVQQGGHQYRVSPGDRLVVDRLEAEVGSVVALEPVLLVQGDGGEATLGAPIVDGARVAAVVVAHTKGRKLRVFKYKPKKRYRRTQGHRSHLTELRVEALLAAGEPLPKPAAQSTEAEEPQARTPAAKERKSTRRAPEAATTVTDATEEAGAPDVEATKSRPRARRATKPAAAQTEEE